MELITYNDDGTVKESHTVSISQAMTGRQFDEIRFTAKDFRQMLKTMPDDQLRPYMNHLTTRFRVAP